MLHLNFLERGGMYILSECLRKKRHVCLVHMFEKEEAYMSHLKF